jgi:hypothetical protein
MRLQVALVDASGSPVVSAIDLASLKVEATERQFARPQPKFVQEANFGNSVRLLGYDLDTTTVKPGATFHLALYWQPIARMSKSYTVFVHLLDANSKIWAQRDSAPKGGARPTTGWVTQEFIADSYELTVDAGAPAGDYVLEVGMYDAGSPAFPRLSVIDANGKPGDNRVLLGTSIRVSP